MLTGNQPSHIEGSARLEIDGKSVLISNDKSSWSINRKTYDVQRSVLGKAEQVQDASTDGAGGDIESQDHAGENPWSAIKSFDRSRDLPVSNQQEQASCCDVPSPNSGPLDPKKTAILSLAALGVVYGDIGTSPLYTIQTMYASLPINDDNIIGGISALLWTIMLVVTLKYVTVVMRVNNRGEGGVMALTALASQSTHPTTSSWWKIAIMMLGKHGSFYAPGTLLTLVQLCRSSGHDSLLRRLHPDACRERAVGS